MSPPVEADVGMITYRATVPPYNFATVQNVEDQDIRNNATTTTINITPSSDHHRPGPQTINLLSILSPAHLLASFTVVSLLS